MAEPKTSRPFLTGFCTPTNPKDSHGRCPVVVAGHTCTCRCHKTAVGEAAPGASAEPLVERSPASPAVGTLTVLPALEQRSDEWYDQRRGMVTASAVGALITPSTLKVASNDQSRGLIATLVAERITGYTEPSFLNNDMVRGIEDEPRAIDTYTEHFGRPVERVGFMVRSFDFGNLGYSPDGLVGDDGLIEVKCPRAKGHVQTLLAGKMPAFHMAQCQAGLLVSGRKWLDFISFCGGLPMFTDRILPDPAWHEAIVAAVENFEAVAAQMLGAWPNATEGLPMTERIDFNELGLVI